jgi:sensor histidine kinase regulating citrate/malate metabolism
MDEQTRNKIFDLFYSTMALGQGKGAGLAATFGFIKKCSGLVQIDATPDQGNTFNIYLPESKKQVTPS